MKLSSRYELIKTAGTGGFGEVVHVKDKRLERSVAIKNLDPLMALDSDERDRFAQEARVLASMSHPNIPSIYDVEIVSAEENEDGDARFQIYFEWIEGRNLFTVLRDDGPAILEDARNWFSQLASALSHAHDRGIWHRDVKPKNIIIGVDGQFCYLVDFGLALTNEQGKRMTKEGYVVGTEGYMSPEQMAGDELDHRTDIFNLGICLYETLAGTPIPHGDYKNLSLINEGVPPAVDDLIQECLLPRDHRIQSPGEFAKQLANALSPKISLTSVLAEGRLSDLETALAAMTPGEFAERPAGQRALINSKILDLAEKTEARFEYPTIQILSHLIHLGTRLPVVDYKEIIDIAFMWAFFHEFSSGDIGDQRLRRKLAGEAATLPPNAHNMVADKFIEQFNDIDLSKFNDWDLNGLRDIVSNLLANRACEENAAALAKIRRAIDAEHRVR